jgi:hypothetical protein
MMVAMIQGVRYNSDNCEVLGEYDHYNNGNYSGTTYLLRALNGTILVWTNTNGQDLYMCDTLYAYDRAAGEELDSYRMTDEQAARCVELGLIKIDRPA